MKKLVGSLVYLFLACELWAVPEVRTVLVFPFENQSARGDLDWISESFAETLSTRLASPSCYVLGREERNAAEAQLGIPPGAPLTLASEYKVSEILGVDWAVVGSFNVQGQSLIARAQLLDVHRLNLASPLIATGALTELVNLQTQLAWRLLATRDPNFTTGSEEDFRRQFLEVRLDAFENYMRGILATDGESRVRFLCEADRLDPSNHRAAFELGRHYFDQKDYANSAKWFRKLGDRDAHYLESLFLLGVDEYFLGHYAAAEKAFETLSKEIPLNEVSNNLGVMKSRRGRYTEALPSFARAYEGDPTDPDFCFNLAACYWYLKRYDEAAKCLREAVRASDDDPEAHSLLAAVLEKLGDSAGVHRELAWLSQHEGNSSADLNRDFSPQLHLKKNYDGRAFRLLSLAVRNVLEERLAKEPAAEHGAVHLSQGKKFLAEGRLPEAERELAEAVSLLPHDSEAHLALAQADQQLGRHAEAAAELETSLRLKNSVVAHLWLARVYLSLDQPQAANDHTQAALRLDPGNQEAARLIDRIRQREAAAGKTP